MSRLARDAYESNLYHVMVQGINKERVFGTDTLKKDYIYKLVHVKEQYDIKLLAYCVMDTHCHILLHVPSVEAMGEYMRKVNTTFAQYYNFSSGRVGYVFRDRYKSQPIYDERYLLTCLAYIHNNPVKAGIAANPSVYQFSSCQAYLRGVGQVDLEDAKQFFDISPENMQAVMRELKGDECDIEWIDVEEDMPSATEKAEKVLSKFGMPAEELRKNRGLFLQAVKEMSDMGMTRTEIANEFNVSISFISRFVRNK